MLSEIERSITIQANDLLPYCEDLRRILLGGGGKKQ